MSLAAHTNAVGYHTTSDSYRAREWGRSFGSTFNRVVDSGSFISATSEKPAPFQAINGDRGRSYNYSRHVRRVQANVPALTLRYDRNPSPIGTGPTHEYWTERYAPMYYKTLSYNPEFSGAGNAWDESVTEALNNLGKNKSSLGASLAEGRQTVELFANKASHLASALKAMRHGNFGLAAKLVYGGGGKRWHEPKTASSAWLEFQYGWKPLIQDVHDTAQQAFTVVKKEMVLKGTGFGRTSTKKSFQQNIFKFEAEGTYTAKCVLKAKIVNTFLVRLNNLGLINPISIAWELVPWSFAIDWFIPVGAFLEALTADVGLEDLGGQITTQTSWFADAKAPTEPRKPQGVSVESGGHYREAGFDFHRYALTSHPRPALYAKENPFSTPHVLNALALMTQLHK